MEGFRKMNKEKYDKLDKRETELIGEGTDIQWEIIWKLRSLIEIDFDSDTLKTKIISLMKSHSQINAEICKITEEMDFMKKCDKEGYVNKSDQWDKDEKEDFEK
jgi:hypothetical protein